MSKVTMVCGAPASGKSTFTKKLTDQGFVPLNRDTEGGTIAGLLPKLEAHLKMWARKRRIAHAAYKKLLLSRVN